MFSNKITTIIKLKILSDINFIKYSVYRDNNAIFFVNINTSYVVGSYRKKLLFAILTVFNLLNESQELTTES